MGNALSGQTKMSIGGSANVVSDYMKIGPKKLYILHTYHHNIIDVLDEFSQELVYKSLLTCLHVRYLSMFTNISGGRVISR